MNWAFWRRASTAPGGVAARPASARALAADDESPRSDPAADLRVRARRRLIGAAALLLAVVVLVPMVLDPAPRPVSDAVPIDIPSERSPFTARLALPPVPEPGSAPMPPPDVGPVSDDKGEAPAKSDETNQSKAEGKSEPRSAIADDRKAPAKAEAKTESRLEVKADPKADSKANSKPDAKTDAKMAAEAQRARDLLEGKAADKKARYAVQAAALSSETAAKDLSTRLSKAGLAPYTEQVQTPDGPRWRVRLGPYATREEAEKVRVRLRALDMNATLVGG
ncbi:MAG: SPOR domain-containing protein [Betaproteobacteria bacterium]